MNTKKILNYVLLGGLFLIPFIPFIVPSGMFFPFITGKGFTFRILTEILFGLYVILAFMAPEYRPKMSWISKALLFFAGAILLADLFSANVLKSLWSNYERMEGFVLIAHLVLYYIVATGIFNSTSKWYTFFNISILSSVVMSLYGALQLAGKLQINQGGVRLDGTFGNASYFAIYLVLHIFLALYFLSKNYQVSWKKWVYGIVVVLESWILYFTATRGAILGLILGLVLTAIITAWKEKENLKLKKLSYTVLIGIVVFIGLFVAVRNTSFVKSSPVLSRFAISTSEIENQGRYYVWPMAIKGFLERPVLGWGQESFNFVFNKYYDPRMYGQEQWFDRTHDVVLDWLVAGGLVGLLAYGSLFVALLYCIWKKDSPMTVIEKALLTGMISAYVFHNLFVFDNLISYILFISVLAYVHTGNTINQKPSGQFQTKTFNNDTILYIVAPIVLVFVVGTVYFVNVPAIEANYTLIQALSPQASVGPEQNLVLFKQDFDYNSFGSNEVLEQLIQVTAQVASSQTLDATKQKFYDFTKQKLEEKLKATPNDARYFAFAGSFYNSFAQYDDAIRVLKRAVELSPKKQAMYFELGTSYVGQKNYQKAFELFKQAYDLEPNSTESQIIYAVGAIYTKNADVLKSMTDKLDKNVFVNDNRFLRAYADIGDFQTVADILNYRLVKDPKNMQFKLSLASAYLQLGQKQKAIAVIQDMIKQDSSFQSQGEAYIKQIQGQ